MLGFDEKVLIEVISESFNSLLLFFTELQYEYIIKNNRYRYFLNIPVFSEFSRVFSIIWNTTRKIKNCQH